MISLGLRLQCCKFDKVSIYFFPSTESNWFISRFSRSRMYVKTESNEGFWQAYLKPFHFTVLYGMLSWIIVSALFVQICRKLRSADFKLKILSISKSILTSLQIFCNQGLLCSTWWEIGFFGIVLQKKRRKKNESEVFRFAKDVGLVLRKDHSSNDVSDCFIGLPNLFCQTNIFANCVRAKNSVFNLWRVFKWRKLYADDFIQRISQNCFWRKRFSLFCIST